MKSTSNQRVAGSRVSRQILAIGAACGFAAIGAGDDRGDGANPACNEVVNGTLSTTDFDYFADGTRADEMLVNFPTARIVRITMQSTQFTFTPRMRVREFLGIIFGPTVEEPVAPDERQPAVSFRLYESGAYLITCGSTAPITGTNPYRFVAKCAPAPIALACGIPLDGAIDSTDADLFDDGTRNDYYTFTLPQPARVEISMQGDGLFRPQLDLRRMDEGAIGAVFISALSPDSAEPAFLASALQPGTYLVAARNPQSGRSDPHEYQITLTCLNFATPTVSFTPFPTLIPTASATDVPTATASPTQEPTASATPSLSPTPLPTTDPSPTASPSASATISPSETPTPTTEPTPSTSPTPTASPAATESPTAEPSPTPASRAEVLEALLQLGTTTSAADRNRDETIDAADLF